ncbi:hypothetical protein CDL15_Pgr009472 [Punica granatum]|uniref:Uncharacterized protein n=1 Tax=Punica granatum TaxID=22663 RepID=A0A218WTJ1_PUNGR|nr:hypothetical protein CDL15_Pgr009472 [Punica granatum]PKI55926.1 hypothetical protein CRG98_023658 [Punica granatum]
MLMSIPSKHLSLAILCFLLIPDYQLLLQSRAAPGRHGDDENNKGKVGGHGPKSDGSHVTSTPTTTSHSPNPAGSQAGASHHTITTHDYGRRVNSPPQPPVDQDPLEASTYRFNCTLCD